MVETTSGNQHSLSANRNWLTNSVPYGYGGRSADTIVLPVRIIMSPTSSSRLFAGRNARSATLRTMWVWLLRSPGYAADRAACGQAIPSAPPKRAVGGRAGGVGRADRC